MLEAERALAVGLLDQAERLYRRWSRRPAQLDRDRRARPGALERGDERTAYLEAKRALALDPDNPMASHLTMRMAEIMPGVARRAARGAAGRSAPEDAAGSKPRGLTDRLLRRRR
jgi:hypothetical protein